MDVDFDFSDVDSFFDEGEWEVEKKMIDVGDEAVKYAEEHGDYQDHTLTLRTSNDYDVDKDGLTLKNEAEYASFVESNINRKTFCSAFPNHFVSILHLLTQNELWFFHSFSNNF